MNAEDIAGIKEEALREAAVVKDIAALEAFRIKYAGRKGILQDLMQNLKTADPADRPVLGKVINELKNELITLLDERKKAFEESAPARTAPFDITLPGQWPRPVRGIRSARSSNAWWIFFILWVSPWPKGRTSRRYITTSTR